MYVLVETGNRMALHRLRPWHSLAARLQAGTLDRELARGDTPESCQYLAARAQQLTSARYRRGLAASLSRLLAQADGRPSLYQLAKRNQVAAAADELSVLAERLRTPGPVPVRGVAMVCDLLRDGAGPVYQGRGPAALRHAAGRAIQALAGQC
jgi:hypothetical protein